MGITRPSDVKRVLFKELSVGIITGLVLGVIVLLVAWLWRGNFYRIERPHDAEPEFSGWSPTMTDPADFHKPAYFGILELETEPII